MSLRLTFIGPPGSGKGTQARLLRESGFVHASSGDMLRAEIAAGTELGRAVDLTMRRGDLVGDVVLAQIVGAFLRMHARDSIVLDGYPRTVSQALHLSAERLHAAVFFQIPDSLLLRRLGDRVIGADGAIYDLQLHPPPLGAAVMRRSDDDPLVQRHRLAAFREQEIGLREYYDQAGLALDINAALPLDQVRSAVNDLVRSLCQNADRRAVEPAPASG